LSNVKELARLMLDGLLQLAVENARERPDLSDRYASMAMRLSERTRVRLSKDWKHLICGSCGSFIYPGIGSRVRVVQRRAPHVVVTCLRCGCMKRYAIGKTPTSTEDKSPTSEY